MRKQHHYIYKITNIITNKYYIGMHTTYDLNDDYFGSGLILKRSVKKYGKDNHVKEITHIASTREELVHMERNIVNENLLKDPFSMNIRLGGEGGGGWTSQQQRENNKKSQETQKRLLENDAEWVKRKSEKLSKSGKLAYAEGRNTSTPPDWTGKKHSEESKRKISESKKGKCVGENNSQYGTKWAWVNKDTNTKKIKRDDLLDYLNKGWNCGTTEKTPIINICEKCHTSFNAKKHNVRYCSNACKQLSRPNKVRDNFQKLYEAYLEHGTLCKAFNACNIIRSKTGYNTFYEILKQWNLS